MLETLYKTGTPEVERSECYEISVKAQPGHAARVYSFREDHGWWDDSEKRFIHQITTINTEQESLTLEEAEEIYRQAKDHLIRNGFVHSFAPDYYADKPYEYQLLEAEAAR